MGCTSPAASSIARSAGSGVKFEWALFRKAELFPLTSRVVRKGALSQLPSILQGATNFLLDQEQPRCDNSAMRSTPKSNRACSQEGAVLTKATIRAADRLDVSQKVLASIIG